MHLGTDWWELLWPAALAGVVVGTVTALIISLRVRGGSPARPWQPLSTLGAVGVVLGLAVATTLYQRSRTAGFSGAPRRYVDYLPTSGGAYGSALTLSFDDPGNVWTFVLLCAITGLVVGLVAGAVLAVSRRAR